MNLCGSCIARPPTNGDGTRFRWTDCDGCGLRTECAIVDPPSVTPPIRPRWEPPASPWQRLREALA